MSPPAVWGAVARLLRRPLLPEPVQELLLSQVSRSLSVRIPAGVFKKTNKIFILPHLWAFLLGMQRAPFIFPALDVAAVITAPAHFTRFIRSSPLRKMCVYIPVPYFRMCTRLFANKSPISQTCWLACLRFFLHGFQRTRARTLNGLAGRSGCGSGDVPPELLCSAY